MVVDMPAAEVDVTPRLVTALLEEQRPHLAHLHVRELANGWDNVSMRVGDDMVARLPRRAMAVPLVHNEARWLPDLAPGLPIPVPVPLYVGSPGHGYPWPWTLVPWIQGEPAASADLDLDGCAMDLGDFLRVLHREAPEDAPENPYRGIPLSERAQSTMDRITRLDLGDPRKAISIWQEAVATAQFDGPHVWLHGDLHPANLLAVDGRLSGVIDFGDLTRGDPATDLAVAWTMFPAQQRHMLRDAYGGVDDDTWTRARGWALSLGTAYLAHSADNRVMAAIGRATIDRVLDEAPVSPASG